MSWVGAKIGIDKSIFDGSVNNERVFCPCPKDLKEIKTLTIDGKSMDIQSWELDSRDQTLKIVLAMASTQTEMSDDQPTKGRDNA
jgi:hypothetical protein